MGRVVTLVALVLALAGPAAANDYRAERFDVRVEVQTDGSLRVTETLVFRFEEGTFRKVERVIPTRRTDGIEFVEAMMDGTRFAPGTGAGQVSLRKKDGLRIEWLFAPVGPSTHTFTLTYVARGVVQTTDAADVISWRALPSQHKYEIDESTIDVVLPAAPIGLPRIQARRVGSMSPASDQQHVTIAARDIRRNGWIEVTAQVARGAAASAPPQWQQRQQSHARYRTPALTAAAVVLFATIALVFALRQNYDTPPRDIPSSSVFSGPPDDLPPALAGAVASNGSPKTEHAFAALFALGDRGSVTVEEQRGRLGTRAFTLARGAAPTRLRQHEQTLLDAIFEGADRVTLSKAHGRVTRRFGRIRDAILGELGAAGLLDTGRQQIRRTYNHAGVALLALAGAAALGAAIAAQRYGPWPFTIAGALGIGALVCFIVGSAHTPLSNDGVRRSATWRAYRKFLRDEPQSAVTLLPYAIALGLGMHWARLFKKRGVALPSWFQALSTADAHRAFGAFVATSGAHYGHGGGAGGGGAAGGGSSGAS